MYDERANRRAGSPGKIHNNNNNNSNDNDNDSDNNENGSNTGVCEINTHPTCRQCRRSPLPTHVNVHGRAKGECNRSVK